MRPILVLSALSLLLISATSLKKGDVKETFDEMLHLHVEHDQMSPLLIKRASKIFIEQFDSAFTTHIHDILNDGVEEYCGEVGMQGWDTLVEAQNVFAGSQLGRVLILGREGQGSCEGLSNEFFDYATAIAASA